MDPTFFRCHDYDYLIRRWRSVARRAGLRMRAYSSVSGYDLFSLTSSGSPMGGVYLSAGIHGDEAASTEGLIRWAETNTTLLRKLPCVIYPCLNPWGLVNNSRLDEEGRDLNRLFLSEDLPFLEAWKEELRPYRFALALTLHEDYDGQGLYLYEVKRRAPYWGEHLLEVARPLIPIEPRAFVDGRRVSKRGILRRKLPTDRAEFPMAPEAVYLHWFHSERTFTFETPSEFALEQRVQVQSALVNACVVRYLEERR